MKYIGCKWLLLLSLWCSQLQSLRARLDWDSIMSLCIIGDRYEKDVFSGEETRMLKSAIKNLSSRVLPQISSMEETRLLGLCFENRLYLADYLHLGTDKGYQQRIKFRDHMMAKNVKALVPMFNDHQVIIWAANSHIGQKGIMGKKWTQAGVKSMGEHLEQDFLLYRVAIDSKRKKKEAAFFQENVITEQRILVDPKYLVVDCHHQP